MEAEKPDLQLIWGGEEIAKIIGRSRRVTFHLLKTGELPAKKIGDRWVADRNELIAFFRESEKADTAGTVSA